MLGHDARLSVVFYFMMYLVLYALLCAIPALVLPFFSPDFPHGTALHTLHFGACNFDTLGASDWQPTTVSPPHVSGLVFLSLSAFLSALPRS